MSQKKLTKQEIEVKVKEAVADIVDTSPAKLSSSSKLVDDLGMDSLAAAETLFAIKEKLGVDITEDNIPNVSTLGQIVDYIDKKING